MSNIFQIGAAIDACGGLLPVVRIIKRVIGIIQIFIPIGLIVYGTIDLGKAVISSDDKEVKQAQNRLIKRFIYAAAVFLVFVFVNVVMNIISTSGEGDTQSWVNCWKAE